MAKLILITSATLLAVFLATLQPASVHADNGNLSRRLTATLTGAKLGNNAVVGAYVINLSDGSVIANLNGNTPMIPASNQKVLTTAAALCELGEEFKFVTSLHIRGQVRDGVLDGDLMLRGTGDPNISGRDHGGDTTKPLRIIAAGLETLGIRRVTGALYFDGTAFSGDRFHPDWPEDQYLRWYTAEVSALTLNDNCLTITVAPSTPGQSARITVSPQGSGFTFTGAVSTTGGRGDPKVGWSRTRDGTELKLWGELSASRGAYSGECTVPDPDRFCATVFKHLLEQSGVSFAGDLHDAATIVPATGKPVAQLPDWREVSRHESDLASTVYICNTRSQNLYAECILRALGNAKGHGGSFAGGAKAVEAFLKRNRIPSNGLVVSDGSGLARTNQVSPETLTRLLTHLHGKPEGETLRASLAVAGQSGTLERRLTSESTKGRVFAKTGTIRAVTTLSGYVRAASGTQYAFAVFVNNGVGGRAPIDQFVTTLATNG